jgi:hypothetical protein
MAYELIGKIKVLGDVEQKTENFKVRKFVVTIDAESQYPQQVELQAANDKCDMLNQFTVGSDVKVAFNLRGREWTSPQGEVKYFNTLDAWRVEAAATAGQAPQQGGAPQPNVIPENQNPVQFDNSGDDNLPF